MTLSIFDAARDAPSHTALIVGSTSLTFAELAEHVERRLRELSAAGMLDPEGERPLAVVATPTLATVATLLALFAAGTPALLLHPRATDAERAALGERARVIGLTPTPPPSLPAATVPGSLDPERIAVIVPTSGTTGAPRLARLSHRALIAAARASARHLGMVPNERWLVAIPLAHVGGLSILTRSLVARRTTVLFDPEGPLFTRLDALARAVTEHEVTLLSLVPAVLDRLLDEPVSFRGSPKLRAVLLGGAPVPRALLVRAHALGIPVLTTYGLTETSAQAATRPYAERLAPPPPDDLVPAGVPLPGVFIHCVGGLIDVRGPTLFSGYVGEPDTDPRKGWFTTADRGHFTHEGALVVTGRASDLIITGGENVDPVEVEATLSALPGVEAACVVGVPDPTFGELVTALVVAPTLETLGDDPFRALLAPHLASFKLPRRIAFVSDLPLLASGKVDRRAARARAESAFPPALENG